jgi:hypothetical protein
VQKYSAAAQAAASGASGVISSPATKNAYGSATDSAAAIQAPAGSTSRRASRQTNTATTTPQASAGRRTTASPWPNSASASAISQATIGGWSR